MARGTAPKGGMQPKTKAPAKSPAKRAAKIAAGAPTSGGGADTSPYSSARKGSKKG